MKKTFSFLFIFLLSLFFLIISTGTALGACGPCEEYGAGQCFQFCWNIGTWYISCSPCGGGPCFTSDTKVATPGGEIEIEKVKEGDVVKSFDAQTGEIRDATVSAIHKTKVSGYYILRTESGREVKVTGEHPFLAVKQGKVEKVAQVEKVGEEIISFLEGAWEKVREMVK